MSASNCVTCPLGDNDSVCHSVHACVYLSVCKFVCVCACMHV